jgi:hypothetical protein
MPNGQILHRSVRNIALLEPDFAVKEKTFLDQTQKGEDAGSDNQMLMGPIQDGQPELVLQSPDHHQPCHTSVNERDDEFPGDADTVTANPVHQEQNTGNTCLNASGSKTRLLRETRHRKGYYKKLSGGQSNN